MAAIGSVDEIVLEKSVFSLSFLGAWYGTTAKKGRLANVWKVTAWGQRRILSPAGLCIPKSGRRMSLCGMAASIGEDIGFSKLCEVDLRR